MNVYDEHFHTLQSKAELWDLKRLQHQRLVATQNAVFTAIRQTDQMTSIEDIERIKTLEATRDHLEGQIRRISQDMDLLTSELKSFLEFPNRRYIAGNYSLQKEHIGTNTRLIIKRINPSLGPGES